MNVAVIGAAGYLGVHVVDALLAKGHKVTAVARQNAAIHLHDKAVDLLDVASVKNHNKTYDTVINLAYSNASIITLVEKQNTQIAEQVKKLLTPGGSIVHASSMAVFGMELEKTVKPTAVEASGTDIYVFSKQHMENLFLQFSAQNTVHIVRIGCLFGPGSETWTARLAERLIFGMPVANKFFGYSNVTDVFNAADYFCFLAEKNSAPGKYFHHLAEFSELKWDFWLNAMAEALNTKAVIAEFDWPYTKTDLQEIQEILSHILPVKKMLHAALQTRLIKFKLQKIMPYAPKSIKNKFKEHPEIPNINAVTKSDIVLLKLLSTEKLFAPVLDETWQAPVSAERSLKNTIDWMKEAGHILPV